MKKNILLFTALVLMAGCGDSNKAEDQQSPVAVQSAGNLNAPSHPMIVAGMKDLKQGRIPQAIKSFEQAIKANPRDVQGYLILGETYMHLKEYNRAIDAFTIATRVDPQNGQAYFLLATNLGMVGNYSLARVEAEKSALIFRKNKDIGNLKRSVVLLQGLPSSQAVK